MPNIQTISAAELPDRILACYEGAVSYALLTGDPASCFLRIADGGFDCAPAVAGDAPSVEEPERWARFQEIRVFGAGEDAWHFWRGPAGEWYSRKQVAEGSFEERLYPLLGDRVEGGTAAGWVCYRDGRGPEVWVPSALATAKRVALRIHHNTGPRSVEGAVDPEAIVPVTVITDALLLGVAPIV